MLITNGITMQFGSKPLFEDVSVKFGGGNRYGLIGANGCGKSTFMKILAKELDSTKSTPPDQKGGKRKRRKGNTKRKRVRKNRKLARSPLYQRMRKTLNRMRDNRRKITKKSKKRSRRRARKRRSRSK